MKYSLRSLMIVVTLACVVLGGRIEYLRRTADFYKRQRRARLLEFKARGEYVLALSDGELIDLMVLEARYRRAVYRPWTIVDDSP
jgi:hypothetical protein